MASPPQPRDLADLGMTNLDPSETSPSIARLKAVSEALRVLNGALQQMGQLESDALVSGCEAEAVPRPLPGAGG